MGDYFYLEEQRIKKTTLNCLIYRGKKKSRIEQNLYIKSHSLGISKAFTNEDGPVAQA